MKNLNIGSNFMTIVEGSLTEHVKGKRDSIATEVIESSKKRQISSEGDNDIHSSGNFNNNSGETSKLY